MPPKMKENIYFCDKNYKKTVKYTNQSIPKKCFLYRHTDRDVRNISLTTYWGVCEARHDQKM